MTNKGVQYRPDSRLLFVIDRLRGFVDIALLKCLCRGIGSHTELGYKFIITNNNTKMSSKKKVTLASNRDEEDWKKTCRERG